jgi:hypothetical protein
MKFLTHNECAAWSSDHGFLAELREHRTGVPRLDELTGSFHAVKFPTPTDSGRKVAFAHLLYSLFDPSNTLLIWLGNWSVWPSSTHMPLFARFRQAFGEDRPLIEIPGQLVAQGESDDAISLITIALQFVWDCHVFSGSGRDVAFISHDEHGWFASRDRSVYDAAERQIGNFLATPTDVRG